MALPPSPTTARVAGLGGLAALVHLACDAATYPLGWGRAPYLRLEDMPEAFRQLPLVSAPVAVSVAASLAGGVLAIISLQAVDPGAPRRRRLLMGLVTGFWLFTALLGWATWLSTPFAKVLPGVALGVPRGVGIGWLLWRLSGGAGHPASGAPRPA